jgi:hypothetical protein
MRDCAIHVPHTALTRPQWLASVRDYYGAAPDPKMLWKVHEAGHVGGFQARPREYEQRVTRFFDRALLGG